MTTHQQREWHPAFEEYCETIFELREEDVDVIQARVAERLELSRPAVSEMIRRMHDAGLVELDSGTIHLTATGLALAEAVIRRHRLAERFLTDILGLSWTDAHSEAGRWEHVLSPTVEAAMMHVLGDPTTCPHGNPIPGTDYHVPNAVTLDTLASGSAFVVSRIPEELEFTPGLLAFLEESSLFPGHSGVVGQPVANGDTTVVIDGREISISLFAAQRILVTAS